jgi:hypothetical protein
MSGSNLAVRLDRAIDRAASWFRGVRCLDGTFEVGETPAFFDVPPFCRAIGEGVFAQHYLDRVFQESLPEGTGYPVSPGLEGMVPYMGGWWAWGARMWDRVEMSRRVLDYALTFQDAKTGGLFGSVFDRNAGKGQIHFDSTAIMGLACTYCGRIAEAEKIGDFLLRLHRDQPDSENRYLWRWNSDGTPLLDYPEKDALDCVMVRGAPRQGYWKSGLLISCLTLLHAETGTPEYLQTACAHFQRAVQNADDVTRTAYSHKLAWASALLYRVTGISWHRRIAVEIAEHLMSLQRKDGSFVYPEAQRPEKGPNPWEMSTTFQFATWLHTVRSIL